jgi:DNA mismatch repair protein MutL
LEIEEFGDNKFRITAVPDILKEQNSAEIIKEILADLETGNTAKAINNKSNKTIAYLACRSAIKAGDILSIEERKRLLDKLAQTKTNYTCPHGRPVRIEIPIKNISKIFKRIK